LIGQNIPFVNHVKYLGVIFDKRTTWRLHIEITEAKAFRRFIRIYSLLKRERLIANVKLTLHKVLTLVPPGNSDLTFHHWKGSNTPNIKDLRTELTRLEHHKLFTTADRAKQFLQRVSLEDFTMNQRTKFR
jgi:hypothetical protein